MGGDMGSVGGSMGSMRGGDGHYVGPVMLWLAPPPQGLRGEGVRV